MKLKKYWQRVVHFFDMKKKKLFIPNVKSVAQNTIKTSDDSAPQESIATDVSEITNDTQKPVIDVDHENVVSETVNRTEENNDVESKTDSDLHRNESELPNVDTGSKERNENLKESDLQNNEELVAPQNQEEIEETISKVEPKKMAPAAKPLSFSNDGTNTKYVWSKNNNWIITCASSIGQSHIQSNIPCQDNHYCETVGNGWGLAICSDGAGSAKYSHVGSNHVANEIGKLYFKKLVIKNGWHKNNYLPTEEEWTIAVREGFKQIYFSLERLAESSSVGVTALACTIIVVIYSPIGLLVAHIGDGRAGFLNKAGEWRAVITPHKGEEANQTIFLTSEAWITNRDFTMSDKSVPECKVINEAPLAFTLMTDGCETHSFECSKMNNETNKWHDPNLPYPKFFNPLIANIKAMHENNLSGEAINEKWRAFIEKGTKGLQTEPDDKTMILGVLI